MHAFVVLVAAATSLLAAAQSNCNCQGVNGWCGVNCTSSSGCCGSGTMEPSCMLPGNQCCSWYLSSTQCSDTESCCGELGYGASSSSFCCGAGSSCCATSGDGSSQCCGPKQQCCKGYNTFCCDAETEVCGPEYAMVCLPKIPITRNPHAKPGQLEWAANLSSTWNIHAPVVVNSSFVVASGAAGTALVRLSDGAATFILPTSVVAPAVAGGRLITYLYSELMAYDLKHGNQSWNMTFESGYVGLVGHEHYLLAVGENALCVFDARNGTLLYTIPYAYQATKPVVSPLGTAAFASSNALVIFHVDTGRILRNASTTCYTQPPALLAGSIFVSCNLVAYSARDGKQLWASATAVELISIAATTRAIVGTTEQHLYFVARSSGQLIKKVSIGGAYYDTNSLTAAGDEVLVAAANLTAYNGTTGAQLWNYTASTYGFQASGAAHLGYVYLPAGSNEYPAAIVAVDRKTGSIAGSWGAGGAVSAPVFVDSRVLFMAADGLLYCGTTL